MNTFVKGQQVTVWDPASSQYVTGTVRYPYGVSIGVTHPDGSTRWHYPGLVYSSVEEATS